MEPGLAVLPHGERLERDTLLAGRVQLDLDELAVGHLRQQQEIRARHVGKLMRLGSDRQPGLGEAAADERIGKLLGRRSAGVERQHDNETEGWGAACLAFPLLLGAPAHKTISLELVRGFKSALFMARAPPMWLPRYSSVFLSRSGNVAKPAEAMPQLRHGLCPPLGLDLYPPSSTPTMTISCYIFWVLRWTQEAFWKLNP